MLKKLIPIAVLVSLVVSNPIKTSPKDTSDTVVIANTIAEELNTKKNYPILKGTVELRHTYTNAKENTFLFFDSEQTVVATAKARYTYEVALSEAEVYSVGNIIKVEIPSPKLDKSSVHRVADTFKLIEDKSKLPTTNLARETMVKWEDSFDTSAVERIELLHNKEELNNKAMYEVGSLIEALQIEDNYVEIIIKEK